MKPKTRPPQSKSFKKKRRTADPPNLARYRASILQLTSSHDGKQDPSGVEEKSSHPQQPVKKFTKSRKERRKEARKSKKAQKDAYHRGTLFKSKEDVQDSSTITVKKTKDLQVVAEGKERKKKEKTKVKEKERLQKAERTYRQGLLEANKKEDRLIKSMEKSLKMKRRKSKNLPKSFLDDGLDFLLDAVDTEKVRSIDEDPVSDEDSEDQRLSDPEDSAAVDFDSDEEENEMEDEDAGASSSDQEENDGADQVESDAEEDGDLLNEYSDDDEEEDDDLLNECSDDEEEEDGDGSEYDQTRLNTRNNKRAAKRPLSEDDDTSPKKQRKQESKPKKVSFNEQDKGHAEECEAVTKSDEYREDIYGRLHDSVGNVVTQTSAYVPPAKRQQQNDDDDAKKKEQKARLQRQIKGLLNRLSEANLQGVCSELETIYLRNSRADVTQTLIGLVLSACVQRTLIPERLIMEHAGLVTLLHNNIGSEIGAEFLHSLAQRFQQLTEAPPGDNDSKELNNLLVVMANLYNFKVVDSVLIFDIMKELANQFEEKQIELILLLLKNVGFLLRKDDAATLKLVILLIQQKANSMDTSKVTDQSRIKFMLEIITAIKNNNIRRIPNYDPEPVEHLKKLLRSFCRGGTFGEHQMRLPLSDLLNVEQKGRWWLVGSAWMGQNENQEKICDNNDAVIEHMTDVSDKVNELAHEQRMNTDIRRAVFSTLITSEDFVDAFNKLLRLGLKQSQERDVIYVTVDCCLQEKTYNPFYALVVQKFCEYHRRFQMSLSCHVWDKFHSLAELSEQRRFNLAKLLVHLISTHAISLSVLKVLEWGDLSKFHVRLLKQILTALLCDYQEALVVEVFGRITGLPKLENLREGLRLFIKHFLLRGKNVNAELRENAQRAENTMLSTRPKLRM